MPKKKKVTTQEPTAQGKSKKTFAEKVAENRGYKVHKSKKS